MSLLQIVDFGEKNQVRTYRIHGTKDALYDLIARIRDEDIQFDDTPNVLHVRKDLWTVLLNLKVPVGVGDETDFT